MKALLFLLLVPFPAHADLYRWVDPQTGSVKLSNLPPANPATAAEVVPYRGPFGAPVQPQPAAAGSDAGLLATLEARWRLLLAELAALAESKDAARGGEGLRRHLEAYEAVRSELDRIDPAGRKRREAETAGVLDRFARLLKP